MEKGGRGGGKNRNMEEKRKENANEVILYVTEFRRSFQFKHRVVRVSFKNYY